MSYNIVDNSKKPKAIPTQEFAFINGNFVLKDLKSNTELICFNNALFMEIYHIFQEYISLSHLIYNLAYFKKELSKIGFSINKPQTIIMWRLFASSSVFQFMANPLDYKNKSVKIAAYDYSDITTPKVKVVLYPLSSGGYICRLYIGHYTKIFSVDELCSLFNVLKHTKDFDDFNLKTGIAYQSHNEDVNFLDGLTKEQALALYNASLNKKLLKNLNEYTNSESAI